MNSEDECGVMWQDTGDAGVDLHRLEHYHDPKRPRMSMRDRAAQFAPYKTLAGYEEMINDVSGEEPSD